MPERGIEDRTQGRLAAKTGGDRCDGNRRRHRDWIRHFCAAQSDRAKPAFPGCHSRRLADFRRALFFRSFGVRRTGGDAADDRRTVRLPARGLRSDVRLRVRLDVHAGGPVRRKRLVGCDVFDLCRLFRAAIARDEQVALGGSDRGSFRGQLCGRQRRRLGPAHIHLSEDCGAADPCRRRIPEPPVCRCGRRFNARARFFGEFRLCNGGLPDGIQRLELRQLCGGRSEKSPKQPATLARHRDGHSCGPVHPCQPGLPEGHDDSGNRRERTCRGGPGEPDHGLDRRDVCIGGGPAFDYWRRQRLHSDGCPHALRPGSGQTIFRRLGRSPSPVSDACLRSPVGWTLDRHPGLERLIRDALFVLDPGGVGLLHDECRRRVCAAPQAARRIPAL